MRLKMCFEFWIGFSWLEWLFSFIILRLPWDQGTAYGYLAELFMDTFGAAAYYIVVGILLTLFILMCLQHHAFFEIFEHSLREFDRTDRRPHHLYELIRFHISVKA